MRFSRPVGHRVLVVCAAASMAAGCGLGPPSDNETDTPPRVSSAQTTPGQPGSNDLVVESVLARQLSVPWGVAFLPDGGALVTERDSRRLLQVGPESDGSGGLRVTELATMDEAAASGEGGLLGVAVSPSYTQDRKIFVYYTTRSDNRIAVLRIGSRPEPIVTGIPASGIHNGGRLAFGPDGFLYASTGDANQRGLSQDLASLGGKILRMTPEGKPAPGNPFGDSLVWSYGHRNVQGFDWDAAGRMYAMEFGQNTWDELNWIEPGKNYGWPHVEGESRSPEYTNPLLTWKPREASCSGAAVSGTMLVAACLRGERLWLVGLDEAGGTRGIPVPALGGEYGRLRTVVRAPDDTLWITTSNKDGRGNPSDDDDRILRVIVNGAGGAGKS